MPAANLMAPISERGVPRIKGLQGLAVMQVRPLVPMAESAPGRSVIKWIFGLFLPRSTEFELVRSFFEGVHVDQAGGAPSPVQFAVGTEFVQGLAVRLGLDRFQCPLGETLIRSGFGRLEEPVVATKMTGANVLRSPYLRRPLS
ncbi:hypothetical protein [Nocardiopsis metallicus]|uniref:Uncharacterized protein n=1 Tax=Nocardiopsis metallicus TaxID=179819 RepID=A0A840W9F1_9ACTN|nr:hypothetical protein [Nocardiopsis metallicus]